MTILLLFAIIKLFLSGTSGRGSEQNPYRRMSAPLSPCLSHLQNGFLRAD